MLRAPRQLVGLAACCVAAFLVVLLVACKTGAGRWLDGASLQGLIGLQGGRVSPIIAKVARLADPLPFAILTGSVCALAWFTRGPRWALGVAVLTPVVAATSQVLKPLLAYDRPHDFLGHAQIIREAFPSGHATASMALALALIVVAPRAWRPVAALVGGAFTLGVSLSIVILSWHYPSDVIGGYLVAATWALLILAALRAADARWPVRSGREAARRMLESGGDPSPARAVVAVTLAMGGLATGLVVLERRAGVARYVEHHTTATIAAVGIVLAAASVVAGISLLATRRG